MISQVTPTITAGAYSALDQVGGLLTLVVDPGVRKLVSLTITDKARVKAALKVFLCNKAPAVPADNAAASISDADMAECVIAVIDVPSASYVDLPLNSVITVTTGGISVQPQFGSLYAFLMCTGTPTYTSTSDLSLKFGLE